MPAARSQHEPEASPNPKRGAKPKPGTNPGAKTRVGRPRGADAEATRVAILEGALEAFGREGYAGVSVRELTRRLGVSHNLVHHYFGSKEKLWRAAVDHALGGPLWSLVEEVDATAVAGDPFETLADAIRGVILVVQRLPAFPMVLAREAATPGPRIDYICDRYIDRILDVAQRLLERLEEAGAPHLDPRSFILILTNGVMSLYTHPELARRLGGPDPLSEEAARVHAETLAQLVLRGLRPASTA